MTHDPIPHVDGAVAPVVPQGTRLAGATVVLLDRGISVDGKVVTLSSAINKYEGAAPYYWVQRLPGQVRFPVTERRARGLFNAYMQDVTDVAAVEVLVKGMRA